MAETERQGRGSYLGSEVDCRRVLQGLDTSIYQQYEILSIRKHRVASALCRSQLARFRLWINRKVGILCLIRVTIRCDLKLLH